MKTALVINNYLITIIFHNLFVLVFFSFVQPFVKTAYHSIVEPLLNLLRSLHLEVQYEGKCAFQI